MKDIIQNKALMVILAVILFCGCDREEEPLVFTPIDLEQFSENHKGFNLLGKFDVGWSNNGFTEEEFIIVKDLGFNFVRLPLDYLTYTQQGNWDLFLEEEIAEIDKAVEYGKKYGVHVCINLHRAPGYSVNTSVSLPPNQNVSLWTDASAQKAFVNHWDYFATRYRDIPADQLSFNLINEPGSVDESSYVNVMKMAIDRIQSINPDRIIFVDGLNYARDIVLSLKDRKNIIQTLHVYDPFTLTHYKASWVDGSDSWALPVWPMTDINVYLYGPVKSEYQSALNLEGSFPKDMEVIVNVHQVSVQSKLEIKLDNTAIYSKSFVCGSDPGEDWTQIINTQWGYQNISDRDYSVMLPQSGTKITFANTVGDWMTFNKITLRTTTDTLVIIPANTSWATKQSSYKITADGRITYMDGNPAVPLGSLIQKLEKARSENIAVMIQEFGVYNKTPYKVTNSYLKDIITVFNNNNVGYAMWNLIGTMGIINSERTDCIYEPYRGKSIDRQMTEIIQSPEK
ncbi:MAG: cellulase family glycosylhydrolase [Bacteroidetes bacterium]|nr:cellulase family glycosylhydrolase [Bacteroidota bacterium]